MSFSEEYFKLRNKRKKEEEKNTSSTKTNSFADEYSRLRAQRKAEETISSAEKNSALAWRDDEIAPVGTDKYSAWREARDNTFARNKRSTFFKSGGFSDGVDGVGDFSVDLAETIGGTVGDIGINFAKGMTRTFEGITDLGIYGAATVADWFGGDEFADKARKVAQKSQTDNMLKKEESFVDRYSILGDKADAVSEGLGQVATILLTGGAAGAAGLGTVGTTVATSAVTGLSGMGSGMSEAYEGGANDKDAFKYGLAKGAIEAGTELLFGGLGKASKAVGIGKSAIPLDDLFAKSITKKITSQTAKNLVQYGIKASTEGVEEVIAGYLTAHAKKGTYMPEKDFSEILKDENLLESFIVGTLTSAISQSGYVPAMQNGSLRESIKTGRDFITGYTQNEQSVIDKEVENRVAEQEKNGKKLTKREIAKIEEQVQNDLDKGYISIDTIEETLGGDDYKSYKETVDTEEALKSELAELQKMEYGKMNDIQHSRLNELKGMNLEDTTKRDDLRTKLDNKIKPLLENSRIAESYNEKARRGEAFKVDLSNYSEKERATYERAMNSGVLNNTNRSHEFIDVLAKIEADKGITFDFTNNEKLKETGFAIEGKTVNGFANKTAGSVTLNVQSAKAWQSTVGHEITHILEGTDAYGALQEALYKYAESKGELESRRADLTNLYKGMDADIEAELTADLVGDYLFTDKDFINKLTGNVSLFKKVWNEVKYLCKVATGKELTEIEKVKAEFDKVWKEFSNKGFIDLSSGEQTNTTAKDDVTYSISGENALTADKSKLYDAMRKIAFGEDAETVRKDTGWYKGKDNKWRFYIPDNEMEIVGAIGKNDSVQLGNYIEHHKLFAAYPELKNVNVRFSNLNHTKNGKYSPDNNEIVLNNKLKGDTEKIKDTLVHEIQHAIQNIEGFAVGGNRNVGFAYALNMAYDKAKNSSEFGKLKDKKEKFDYMVSVAENLFSASDEKDLRYKAYRNLYGEVEARQAAQDRYFDEDLLRLATPFTSGNVINIEHETKKFIDNFTKIGYTEEEIESLLKGVQYDKSGSVGDFESGSRGNEDFGMLRRGQLHFLVPTSGIDGADGGNQGASRDNRQGIRANVPELSNTEGLGGRVDTDNTNEIAPIQEASPKGGVFFDAENSLNTATTDPDTRFSLSEDTQGNKLSAEQQTYFMNAKTVDENGKLKPFYHGTARADRVGTVFNPDRATSGPMAFFTDNKEVADNYARDKKDTSLAYDTDYDSYETQFRVNRNGKDMSVVELWNTLSMSERNAIKEKAKHITMDEDWENVIYSEEAQYGLGNFDAYELNAHKGNALHTLVDSWLTDGNIYGEEQKFLDVLKLVGIEDAKYMNPDFRDEKTYAVYLNITNPFDTSNISPEIVEAFKDAAEKVDFVEGNSADMWDKRNIPPEQWIARLEDDIANGTTHCWTSIPDFVTNVLKAHGYDGIFDTGGKNGGTTHTVAIPFYSEQIKDVNNSNPTNNPDITRSLSNEGEQFAPIGNYSTPLNETALAPMQEDVANLDNSNDAVVTENAVKDAPMPDEITPITEEEANEN